MKTISSTEIYKRIEIDNPWWRPSEGNIPGANFSPRDFLEPFSHLVTMNEPKRAVILMGPRRVGKTVMIHHMIKQLIEVHSVNIDTILYVSLDTPVYVDLSLENIVKIGRDRCKPDDRLIFFFDEIQYYKDWSVALKSLVDSYPNYKFIASGSASADLNRGSKESGAGRFTDFYLPPLTFTEFVRFKGYEEELIKEIDSSVGNAGRYDRLNDLFIEYINYGGYPEIVFNEEIQKDPGRFIRNDILDKVLLKDLPSMYGIRNVMELSRFFSMLALNTGEEVSMSGLTSSSGVNKETVTKYLDYLEYVFLIKRMRRIDKTGKYFQRDRTFKVYLTNTLLRTALFSPVSKDSDEIGHLVETAVYNQWHHKPGNEINYARWKNGEVDFTGSVPGTPLHKWVVEVKWSDKPYRDPSQIKSILSFAQNNTLTAPPIVTTRTLSGSLTIKGVQIQFIPCSIYCYLEGKQLMRRVYDHLLFLRPSTPT